MAGTQPSFANLKNHALHCHFPHPNVPAANIAAVSAVVQVYADVLGVYDGGHCKIWRNPRRMDGCETNRALPSFAQGRF